MKVLGLIFILVLNSCTTLSNTKSQKIVYQSDHLTIAQLSDHVYRHTSYLQTQDFGTVDCNGMLVIKDGEAIVVDSPTNLEATAELLKYLNKQNFKINAVVATHFHIDCVAGLELFHQQNIPSYANQLTISYLKNDSKICPQNGFEKTLDLSVSDQVVHVEFFGEGHTKDNVVAYFEPEKILFGGCLIKELNAEKGNLADAAVSQWSSTVQKIKIKYPTIKLIIPGHGKTGGEELLDYTISLFQ